MLTYKRPITAKRGPADDLNVFDDVNTRLVHLGQDVPVIKAQGRTSRPEGPRTGVGFLGRGSQPPPHQLGVWGSAVSSPQRVWGGAPAEIEFGAF